MKIQVRNSAWETNSSSMHSLLIMKKRQTMTQAEIRDEFYLDEDWNKERGNILRLDSWGNDFGREFRVLTSFRDKLSYAMAAMLGNCYKLKNYIKAGNEFMYTFEPILKKLAGVDEVEMPMESEFFRVYSDTVTDDVEQDYETYEEVPYEDLVYDDAKEYEYGRYKEVCKSGRKQMGIYLEVPDFGSVDHQSMGLFQMFLRKYGITIEEYLIRKDIVVVVDGDETCIFGTMMDAGLVDKDAIQVLYSVSHSYGEKVKS